MKGGRGLTHIIICFFPSIRCRNYKRGYIRHLFKAQEVLGQRLATYHNLYFLIKLMKGARTAILEDRFEEYKAEFEKNYAMGKNSDWIKPKKFDK